MRDHLNAAWQATGERPDELTPAALPPGAGLLIGTFLELHATRGSNGFGPNPITHEALRAWQHNQRVRLTPYEIDTLLHMDRAALTVIAEQQKK